MLLSPAPLSIVEREGAVTGGGHVLLSPAPRSIASSVVMSRAKQTTCHLPRAQGRGRCKAYLLKYFDITYTFYLRFVLLQQQREASTGTGVGVLWRLFFHIGSQPLVIVTGRQLRSVSVRIIRFSQKGTRPHTLSRSVKAPSRSASLEPPFNKRQ